MSTSAITDWRTVKATAGCTDDRMCLDFAFDRAILQKVRSVPGRSYVKTPRKHWHVPKDLETARLLRELFGDELRFDESLTAWGKQAVREERKLKTIAAKSTATLTRLPSVLPGLYEAVHLGPLGRHMTEQERSEALQKEASFQAADVEFLAQSPAPLNANEQGLGKTLEWIAAVWEAGLEEGDHLVIAPKAACDTTWDEELHKWQEEALDDVGVFQCVHQKREDREAVIAEWQRSDKKVRWVVVNPAMLTLRKDSSRSAPITLAVTGKKKDDACYCDAQKGAHEHYDVPFPELFSRRWRTLVIDEAHRGMVRNHKALTFKSLKRLDVDDKVCLMSGTPMKKLGGADLWGMLNFLNPKDFSSYWRFVDSYYVVTDNGFGKKVGGLREDRESAMYRTLIPFMLRRTKKEATPWLPDKLYVDVNVEMSKPQAKQYRLMEEEAFARAGRSEIFAGGTLDRIVRLKQFANAHSKVEGDKIIPIHSPKVDALIERMEALNMLEADSDRQCLVFSQSRLMVNHMAERIRHETGLTVGVIHGGTTNRKELRQDFQAGKIRVMVIVTTAGGVSLTLDAADDVHLIDEMWSPDDDEQAEDRAHRVSRIHQVTVYTYRTVGTIDEEISITKMEKSDSHKRILDERRKQ